MRMVLDGRFVNKSHDYKRRTCGVIYAIKIPWIVPQVFAVTVVDVCINLLLL